jgi:hypothetical protein
MINECGAIDETRIGGETEELGGQLAQCDSVNHKSLMT